MYKWFFRNQSLYEVQHLYDEQHYDKLVEILQETFPYSQQLQLPPALSNNDSCPDRATQLAMLMDSLWQLKQYQVEYVIYLCERLQLVILLLCKIIVTCRTGREILDILYLCNVLWIWTESSSPGYVWGVTFLNTLSILVHKVCVFCIEMYKCTPCLW